MGKIATEQEAYNIGGITLVDFDSNRCCTYSRAISLECNVNGSYESDQLVQLEDLSTGATTVTITFDIIVLLTSQVNFIINSGAIPPLGRCQIW